MFFLYLLSCFSKLEEECNKPFACEEGLVCKVCCRVGKDECTTRCSDGWTDVIPPLATEEDLKNDICHCVPSLEICL